MKTAAFILPLLLCLSLAYAQDGPKVKFYNRNYVGVSKGLGSARYWVGNKESVRTNSELSLDVALVNGIQIKKHQMGIGVGIDKWSDRWFIPIFFNYSYTFMKTRVSPFGSIDLGYAVGTVKGDHFVGDEKGLVLFRPGFGVQVRLNDKAAFFANAFYKMQSIRTSTFAGGNVNPDPSFAGQRRFYSVIYNFVGLNVGIKL